LSVIVRRKRLVSGRIRLTIMVAERRRDDDHPPSR
jgi:hypothetical protein